MRCSVLCVIKAFFLVLLILAGLHCFTACICAIMAYSTTTIKFISNSIKTDVYFIQSSFSHHQFIEALDSLNGSLHIQAGLKKMVDLMIGDPTGRSRLERPE
jgi:hypothetical protein